MSDALVGWTATAVAVVCYGCDLVPLKIPSVARSGVEPLLYNMYMCLGIALTSLFVCLLGPPVFSLGAVFAALLWCFSNAGGVIAVGLLGLSVTNGAWSGLCMLVMFLWGRLYFGDPVRSVAASVAAMLLLLVGVALLSVPGTGLLPKLSVLQPLYRRLHPELMIAGHCQGSAACGRLAAVHCADCAAALCLHCSRLVHDVLCGHRVLPLVAAAADTGSDEQEMSSAQSASRGLVGASAGSMVLLQSVAVTGAPTVDLNGRVVEHEANLGGLTRWLHACLDRRNAARDEQTALQRSAVRIDGETGATSSVGEPQSKLQTVAVGMAIVVVISVLAGTQLVATNVVAEQARHSIMLFFGFTTFFVSVMIACFWFLVVRRQVPCFHLRESLPAGLLSGAIWCTANYSAILSCRYLGVAIGGTLTNLCMIVAGSVSIFVFKEVTDKVAILWWFASVLVILSGALLLGWTGSI